MRRTRHPRGMTLAELLIGMGVGIFAGALAVGTFLGQQRALTGQDGRRQLTTAARDALVEMETPLRRAGWGIDPRYALDLRSYNCTSTTGGCRDRTGAPDELVFVSRNPFYQWTDNGLGGCATPGGCFNGNAWSISAVTTNSITINARGGETFRVGRVVLATCANGANATMGTISQAVSATAAGTLTLPLVTTVTGNPYKENALTNSCFTVAGAALFLVDRYRYAVQTFNGTSWLVLDTGIDWNGNGATPENGGDAADLIPVVPGVEDLQVAYVYNIGTGTAPDSNTNWITGDNALNSTFEEPDPTVTAPTYTTAILDPSRFNLHPANVRAVRLTVNLVGTRRDVSMPAAWKGDPFVKAEDRSQSLPVVSGGFHRAQTETTVYLRNLESRSPFMF